MNIGFFQKRIEDIINNVLGSGDTTNLTTEQLNQLSSQLALYFSTVLLTLGGIIIIAAVGLWFVKRRSNPSANSNKELDRQRLLQEFETQFLAINNQPSIWVANRSNYDTKNVYEFSLALSPEIRWHAPQVVQTTWHMGDRMAVISDQEDLLTASLLDEVLLWFRRVDRAVTSELISVEDVYSLWRQILPFAVDNRFSFMAAYFAKDQQGDLDDIEPVRQVIIGVIRYCQQQKLSHPINYLNGRLDPLLFDELPKGMKTGLEAAKQSGVSRREPIVMEESSPIITQENKPEHKAPDAIVINPDKVAEKPQSIGRKEPTFSFDNVDVDTKK